MMNFLIFPRIDHFTFSILLVCFLFNSGLINRVDKCFLLFLEINHRITGNLLLKFDRIVKCHSCNFLKLSFVKESLRLQGKAKWRDIYYSDSVEIHGIARTCKKSCRVLAEHGTYTFLIRSIDGCLNWIDQFKLKKSKNF